MTVDSCSPIAPLRHRETFSRCVSLSGLAALSVGCGSGIHVTSIATAPVATPATVTFSAARGTQSAVQNIMISRSKGDPVTAKLTTRAPFAIVAGNSCAEGDAVCQVSLSFAPTTPGTFYDSVVFTDTTTGLTGMVALTGLPIYTPPSVTVAGLGFGNEEIGLTTAAQSVIVSGQDLDSVTATLQPALSYSLTAGPGATATSTSSASCAQGVVSCQLSVAFNPAQDGSIAGTLVVNDTITGVSTTVGLNGVGYGTPGAMAGLDYYLPFTDNSGNTVSDASGNHRDGVISGSGNAALWAGGVGLQPNDQFITIPNASGRATRGLCAYFPAVQTGATNYDFLSSNAVGQIEGQAFDSFYGAGDQGHGTDADFPAIGFSNGATQTSSLQGFTGIHCEEEIVGTSATDLDHILVDGQEVPYFTQAFSPAEVNSAGLTQPMVMSSNTIGAGQKEPVFYSAWGAAPADTLQQAKSRTLSELARLTSLGVAVVPPPAAATDSTCSITGTSIDVGYRASQPPSNLLALDFPCTIHNLAVSGQAPKDMTGAVQDREAIVYHVKAARNIAYNGGPTNGVIAYLETAANAYQDIVDWNTKVHALGYKSIASTMFSRCQVGSHGYTGDQLKQQFNALLLANADQFDWVANQAAAPQIGADNACANATYFSDASTGQGTHLTDAGQLYYVAAERAAFEGIYGTTSTSISGTYTQLPSDRTVLATGTEPFTIFLMDANTANFNANGILCVQNLGSTNVTLAAVPGQTVAGNSFLIVAAGGQQCIRAAIANPSTAGAAWMISK